MARNLISGSGVISLDIGADEYNDRIFTYQPLPSLAYKFITPGAAAVGSRPNPEDPAHADVKGELWRWTPSAGKIDWEKIILVSPLKNAMKSYTCWQIEQNSWGSAVHCYKNFKSAQDTLKDPSEWPWSSEKVLQILASMRTKEQYSTFKRFYLWAEDMQIPGFDPDIRHRIHDLRWTAIRTEQEAVRTRKHVLSLSEERLIKEALTSVVPYEHLPLPEVCNPEETISSAQINGLMGYGKGYRSSGGVAFIVHTLKNLGASPFQTTTLKNKKEYIYRLKDVIPAVARYHILNQLNHLRANITTHLAFALGARPSQISSMDESGFKKYEDQGSPYYSIDVPRRKKRYEGKPTAKRRKFPSEIGLGQKIEMYIRLKRAAEEKGMFAPPVSQIVPLFCSYGWGHWSISAPPTKTKRSGEKAVQNYIRSFVIATGVNRSAKDLRSNVAQRLADAGYSAELIREVLDHARLNHIKAYVQAALGLSEILDRALATHEAYTDHIAKLRGKKLIRITDITSETQVISGTVNRKLISGIGACNLNQNLDGCEQEIIYSCYRCSEFHPFDDVGIHERVVESLRAEVTETLTAGYANEPTKLAWTHQETILYVLATIQLAREATLNE